MLSWPSVTVSQSSSQTHPSSALDGKNRELFSFISIQKERDDRSHVANRQAVLSIGTAGFMAGVGHRTLRTTRHRWGSVPAGAFTSIFAAPCCLQVQGFSLCLTELHDLSEGSDGILRLRSGKCRPLPDGGCTGSKRILTVSQVRELVQRTEDKKSPVFSQISSLICLTDGHRRGNGSREPPSLMAACTGVRSRSCDFSWCKHAVSAGPDLAEQGFAPGTAHSQRRLSAAPCASGSLQTKQ